MCLVNLTLRNCSKHARRQNSEIFWCNDVSDKVVGYVVCFSCSCESARNYVRPNYLPTYRVFRISDSWINWFNLFWCQTSMHCKCRLNSDGRSICFNYLINHNCQFYQNSILIDNPYNLFFDTWIFDTTSSAIILIRYLNVHHDYQSLRTKRLRFEAFIFLGACFIMLTTTSNFSL